MPIKDRLVPWRGPAFRQIPTQSPFGPRDFRFAGEAFDNRWNRQGEPTVYFASDPAVVIGELARHLDTDRTRELRRSDVDRTIFQFGLVLPQVIDLTDPLTRRDVSSSNDVMTFLDKEKARALANFIRTTTDAVAIRVPSVAFLDSLDTRWNLVVFLEKTGSQDQWIESVTTEGTFRLEPSP